MFATEVTASSSSASPAVVTTDRLAGKYLTFQLGREEFGIRVLQVREIMGLQEITAVPQMPPYVRGVINLRGKVIPVICLRAKFGLGSGETSARTCIIVVQVKGHSGPIPMGLIVDGVSEVLSISAGDIEHTPDFGSASSRPYLLGMAKIRDKVKILLDIDQVIDHAETLLPPVAAPAA
jgi:purine-binding chemotaxis protein CheW